MKIYAITQGEYSDYHICALTVSKDKAKRLKKLFTNNFGDEAQIEEYDDGDDKDLRLSWYYSISSGEVTPINEYEEDKLLLNYKNEVYALYINAKDEGHAKKKARDMLAKYNAQKAGI